MTQRFGGKFSPDENDMEIGSTPDGAYTNARVDPVGARSNILFIPAIPMVFMALNDGAFDLIVALISVGFLTLAAWLLRGGLTAEAEYNARKVARKPAFPRKLASSVLTGFGIVFAAASHDHFGLATTFYGLAAAGLHIAAFGIDPLKSKGMEGIDTHQHDRVAGVVDKAEKYLGEMSDAMLRSGDRKMELKLNAFQDKARNLIRTVEEDPRDLTAARKYLGVYLMGARDATAKFADIYSRTKDEKARTDYAALLADLSKGFDARTAKLLLDDRSDLNIEIDVLRDRLQQEGVVLDRAIENAK
jgi:hypothetical protein